MSEHSSRSGWTALVAGTLCVLGLLAVPRARAAHQGRGAPPGRQAGPAEVPERVLRAAVARYYPEALSGRAGPGPVLWVLADGRDRVLRTATGRDGLRRAPRTAESIPWEAAAEALTWEAAAAKLASMPASASPGDLLQWGHVSTPKGRVDVIWVRLNAGLPAR